MVPLNDCPSPDGSRHLCHRAPSARRCRFRTFFAPESPFLPPISMRKTRHKGRVSCIGAEEFASIGLIFMMNTSSWDISLSYFQTKLKIQMLIICNFFRLNHQKSDYMTLMSLNEKNIKTTVLLFVKSAHITYFLSCFIFQLTHTKFNDMQAIFSSHYDIILLSIYLV